MQQPPQLCKREWLHHTYTSRIWTHTWLHFMMQKQEEHLLCGDFTENCDYQQEQLACVPTYCFSVLHSRLNSKYSSHFPTLRFMTLYQEQGVCSSSNTAYLRCNEAMYQVVHFRVCNFSFILFQISTYMLRKESALLWQ